MWSMRFWLDKDKRPLATYLYLYNFRPLLPFPVKDFSEPLVGEVDPNWYKPAPHGAATRKRSRPLS